MLKKLSSPPATSFGPPTGEAFKTPAARGTNRAAGFYMI